MNRWERWLFSCTGPLSGPSAGRDLKQQNLENSEYTQFFWNFEKRSCCKTTIGTCSKSTGLLTNFIEGWIKLVKSTYRNRFFSQMVHLLIINYMYSIHAYTNKQSISIHLFISFICWVLFHFLVFSWFFLYFLGKCTNTRILC